MKKYKTGKISSATFAVALLATTLSLSGCAAFGSMMEALFPRKEQPKIIEAHRYPCKQPHTHGVTSDPCTKLSEEELLALEEE